MKSIRFVYSENRLVHFLSHSQKDACKKRSMCNQTLHCTSRWEGTATERHNIRGTKICKNCLKKTEVPWDDV